VILNKEEFEKLWDLHPANLHEVKILGRPVKTPRWCQAYGHDYAFSGNINSAQPVPPLLQPCFDYVRKTVDHRLNGILVNWYDGRLGHYIGRHRDSFRTLIVGSPIVTVSFGQERVLRMRPWRGQGYFDFVVRNGSVFVIPYSTNKTWTHETLRSGKYQERRISITFRGFNQS
jgi:alkylated DNA repair dioxygenase AlkB